MIIEVTDQHTPMLVALGNTNREVAYELMSEVGNKVRENAKKGMMRSRHNWHQKPRSTGRISRKENGKRVYKKGGKGSELTPYYDSSKSKELGRRTKPNGAVDTPSSMGSMISSFLMEKSGTLIVGGRHKAFTPVTRKDGEVKGVGDRQPAIHYHTQSIIHKLDTGKRNQFHGWGKYGVDDEPMKGFNGAKYVGRHFMVKGFVESKGYMNTKLTEGYEKTMGRAVNKVEIKLKKSTTKRKFA